MSRLSYQYVVLRCVPRADREEFLNVGIALYCEEAKFLAAEQHVDPRRLRALDPDLDPVRVQEALSWVIDVCRGDERAGAAGRAPMGQRFGFVRAPRSTVVRPGPVHGGVTGDPAGCLEHLVAQLVR